MKILVTGTAGFIGHAWAKKLLEYGDEYVGFEVMEYKKTIAAVKYGDQTDVVLNNEMSFLCEYDEVDCLVDKVHKFYIAQQFADKRGSNGYSMLSERTLHTKMFQKNLNQILIRK